jgi:molybdopterin molybdotransferase
MDGYAVLTSDLPKSTISSPALLKVIGALGPGKSSSYRLSHGQTIQVATGAMLPPGADAVIPTEAVTVKGRSIVIGVSLDPGSHVFPAGGDVRRGESILKKGHAIRAQDVGLLVALGFSKVRVWPKPRVSIIATGTELTSAKNPRAGKVPDSHSPVFLRLCQALGCVAVELGVVGDDPKELAKMLRKALGMSDLVLTLGGTSAGTHDLVVGVVSELGPEKMFHGIGMDRGRVAGIASVKGKPILMMPGPIQGAMNAFALMGIPLIEALGGRTKSEFEIHSSLGKAWESRKRFSGFRKVIYVKLVGGDKTVAEPLLAETESIKVLADADGYVVVPENIERLDRGEQVKVKLLPGFSLPW